MGRFVSVNRIASSPDVIEAGRVLATLNDWRAIMLVLMVMVAVLLSALLTIIVWDRVAEARMLKALDKLTAALWAVRLELASLGIRGAEEGPTDAT